YLDDEPLAANPTTKLLFADGKAHVLRAEAPGFARATSEFSPAQDTTVALTLTPVDRAARVVDTSPHRYMRAGRPAAAPTPTPAAAAPAAAAPAAAPVAAAPAKPNCDSPIFLDKDGIRRVRPECR
ncbi:MAG TPA: hypothetical protein VGC79_09885, partial [Polyangiaceae bacterium]